MDLDRFEMRFKFNRLDLGNEFVLSQRALHSIVHQPSYLVFILEPDLDLGRVDINIYARRCNLKVQDNNWVTMFGDQVAVDIFDHIRNQPVPDISTIYINGLM